MVVAEVRVELKKGVADPEGKNTLKALELLGFEGVRDVKTVKVFEIEMVGSAGEAQAKVQEMCEKLLANPVIHNYSVRLK
jgi:phosphoribosylformylglycinamidine synthase